MAEPEIRWFGARNELNNMRKSIQVDNKEVFCYNGEERFETVARLKWFSYRSSIVQYIRYDDDGTQVDTSIAGGHAANNIQGGSCRAFIFLSWSFLVLFGGRGDCKTSPPIELSHGRRGATSGQLGWRWWSDKSLGAFRICENNNSHILTSGVKKLCLINGTLWWMLKWYSLDWLIVC